MILSLTMNHMVTLLKLVASCPLAVSSFAERRCVDTSSFVNEIKIEDVVNHLKAFQVIADDHGGVRTDLSGGYNTSRKYVVENLPNWYTVQLQPLEYNVYTTTSNATLDIPGLGDLQFGVDFADMTYSGAGEFVNTSIAFVNPVLPPPNEPSSADGCNLDDYNNTDVFSKIAVIQRGGCSFAQKALNAQERGAVAVIFFNEGQPDRQDIIDSTLHANSGVKIPIMISTFVYNVSRSNDDITVSMSISAVFQPVTTHNIIASSPNGSTQHDIVVVGAHLDSVSDGPSINDNASGSAALLVVANQLENYSRSYNITFRNQVHFIWFAAEEVGLLGSQAYVDSLDAGDTPSVMLNVDLIASTNYVRYVQTESVAFPLPPGSKEVELVFENYFDSQGLLFDEIPGIGNSDYGPFASAGVPIGGLFSGASELKTEEQAAKYGGLANEPADPRFHSACDTIENTNEVILEQMTKAISHGTYLHVSTELATASNANQPDRPTSLLLYIAMFATLSLL